MAIADCRESEMHDDYDRVRADGPRVLYLSSDPEPPQRIAPLLAAQGIGLCTADAHARADTGTRPKYLALILDSALLAPGQTLRAWIDTLERTGIRGQQLLVIAPIKDIGLRLQAVRANAAACLMAPVVTDDLVAALLLACRPQPKTARRVLVVDDDATQTLLAQRFLTAAGFQVRALTDPLQILEVLAVFEPDLILMDLHMPGADGAELATIIRAQDPFRAVPILFLSAERDPERQLKALNMGGDAFITKPIDPGLLRTTVAARIDAYDALRRRFDLAESRDPATGLATRRHFLMVLEGAIAQPPATQPGTGLVLVAIDGTGQLAQRLGPGGLDLTRERLGQRLRGRTRASGSSISRWRR